MAESKCGADAGLEIESLSRIAVGRLRSFDPAVDEDDLRQEAAIAIFKMGSTAPRQVAVLRGKSNAINLLRLSQSRRREASQALGDFEVTCRHCGPEEEAQHNEYVALATHDNWPRQAEVLRLVIDGVPPAEIARQLRMHPGSVQNDISAAVKRLRETYKTGVTGHCRLGRCRTALAGEAEYKRCTKCTRTLPINEFAGCVTRGRWARNSYCKECLRAYHRGRNRTRSVNL